jgi:adenylate cyclase
LTQPFAAFFFPERGSLHVAPYALVAAAGLVLGGVLGLSPPAARVDWAIYDVSSQRIAATSMPAPGIVVVAIDEPSFTEIGLPWPWPRSLHAALADRLREAGARTIAFDILFDVPAADPADDAALAAAIARAGTVVLATDQAIIEDRGYALTQWTDPIPVLAAPARALGVVRIPFEPDGVIRRAAFSVEGRPSLAAAVASRDPVVGPRFSRATLPHDSLIRFNGPPRQGIVTVSYYQALDAAALPASLFKDHHVIVGRSLAATTIDAQADHFATPMSPQMPGAEIHATILDNLLRDRFIADPLRAPAAALGLSIVAGLLAAAIVFPVGPIAGFLTTVILAGLMTGASYVALSGGTRVPVVPPILAVAGAYAATAAYKFALATRERRLIKRAFQHYVAPAIVEQMLADPSKLKLGGTEYQVTVLFSDLEGFTTLSEHLSPPELSAQLSAYFKEMLDVLLPEHGTLDKLIGDAIMMYFGCPIADERHAHQACRGALAMQERMAALNARLHTRGLPPLKTRIGINSGIVVAGNMGTDTIFNYTILGDAVNLASRLEGVNKVYDTRIILGEDTRHRVGDAFETRELDWIRVKGKTRPVAIYELLAEPGRLSEMAARLRDSYAGGLAHYRAARFAEALATFERALEIDPGDGPTLAMLNRCRRLRMYPPTGWDGVFVATEK